jgi:hypothetical protein
MRPTVHRSCDCQNYAPASNARFDISVSCVFTFLTPPWIRRTACARNSCRSRARVPLYSSTFPSTPRVIFFIVRVTENHMLVIRNKRGQDNVPTAASFAYDSINSAHPETHSSISSNILACLDPGWMLLKMSASFANSNPSRIAVSSVRTLSSRLNCCNKVWRRC